MHTPKISHTDAQFSDPASRYYYPNFTAAAANFLRDHVPEVGPTFYVTDGFRTVIEDVAGPDSLGFICDRYQFF